MGQLVGRPLGSIARATNGTSAAANAAALYPHTTHADALACVAEVPAPRLGIYWGALPCLATLRPQSLLPPAAFESKWHALPLGATIHVCVARPLASLKHLERLALAAYFFVVASGDVGHHIKMFLCCQVWK